MQEYNTIVHFLVLLVDIWLWYFISTFWSYLICYHWDRKMYITAETCDIMEVFGKCWDLYSYVVSQIGRWTRKVLNVYISQPALSWGENTFLKTKPKYKILHEHGGIHLCFEGHETKAMLNNSGPRYKRSRIEQRMNRDIFSCVGLLFVMCLVGGVGMNRWQKSVSQMVVKIDVTDMSEIYSWMLLGSLGSLIFPTGELKRQIWAIQVKKTWL